MPRNNQDLIAKRNRDIVSEYNRLCSVKESGVQKYSNDYILIKLKEKFYLEKETLLKIIKRSYSSEGSQLDLFADK